MVSEIVRGVFSAALLGVIGWAIHLGNRVSVLEVDKESLATLMESRFDDVLRRLGRIEDKLDRE
jgi:hypothetical protein